MITIDSPVASVFGKAVKKRKLVTDGLGITTVGDLLFHFPRRYVRTTEVSDVGEPVEGQQITVVGRITSSQVKEFRDRRTHRRSFRVEVRIATNGPDFSMSFFTPYEGQAAKDQARMRADRHGMFTGTAKRFRDAWQIASPHSLIFAEPEEAGIARSLKELLPIYPLTSKLYAWDLLKVIPPALDMVEEVPEVLPPELREAHGLPDVMTALRWIHLPADYGEVGAAQKRFRYEEALVTQLVLARRRARLRDLDARARTGEDGGLLDAFDARSPFELTVGQREVGEQLERDLAKSHPMNRLLQGEVGSGKTLVALRAMLRVVDSRAQAALLAPTEVLAQQHLRSIAAMMGDLGSGGMLGGAAESTGLALLTGSMPKTQRRDALDRIASGEAGIVIGTHALLEEEVEFADLGLVVVDEQHRFGVEQRSALTDKAGTPPHLLVMTATPIPRTVAMTVFGDLETSVLTELPAGRAPIQTTVVPLADQPRWIDRVWQRIREEVADGHQVYVVCPRITGDEHEQGEVDQLDLDEDDRPVTPKVPLVAVEELLPELEEGALEGLRLGMLHGRLPGDDKDRTMRAFAAGEIDVLVSTTVIEVGVDVANATVMVLMDADRFGVSQLHQLRGRVGRGGLPGLCLLVTRADDGTPARERLAAVEATTDGFELSRVDLEQRREGDVLGRSQSGFHSGLRTLRVLRDEQTIVAAREDAEALLADDAGLAAHPVLADAVAHLEHSRQSEFMEKA